MNLIELVPKDLNLLIQQAEKCLEFPEIAAINLPDIIDLPIRIEVGGKALLEKNIPCLPHFRAIDRTVEEHIKLIQEFIDLGMKECLIISGDNENKKVEKASTLEVVREIKKAHPGLKVYCGMDQYRTSLSEELTYCEKKLQAGADGFFTQPFYDLNLVEFYLKQLQSTTIFLGISPVLSEQNYNWWKNKNKIVFPPEFEKTYPYHAKLAKSLEEIAESYNQHTYLMPIMADPIEYLNSVFR
ncbi:methylenetetrahydrofolate reductase [Candidatus Margulisiibacteriota bacterium]